MSEFIRTIKTKRRSYGEVRELGFGTSGTRRRLINPDGTFNVNRMGRRKLYFFDLYDMLISMSSRKFFLIVTICYILVNVVFAFLYMMAGMENLAGVKGVTHLEQFAEAFFFSGQTITTLGYGRIAPLGFWTSTLAAMESMLGLIFFALITGLFYGRFSRPVAKILFSKQALVAPYKGITAFEFRIANQRRNQLIETEVQLIMSLIDPETETRKFIELKLERKKIDFLALSWTIVHPIDETSPMFAMNKKELESADAEYIIIIKAFDDTYSQTIYSRFSYKYDEVAWGKKFRSMHGTYSGNAINLDLHKMHDMEDAQHI